MEGCVAWPAEEAKRYREAGYWEGSTLAEHLARWVARYSERPALSCAGREISYRQMDERATRLALLMYESGLRTYDRVIMQLFNVPELVYTVYACAKIGAIPICSLPNHRWAEITFLAKEADAAAHVIPRGRKKDFDYEAFAEEVRSAAPSLRMTFTAGRPVRPGSICLDEALEADFDSERARALLGACRPDPTEPAFFQLSGGTTGTPKIIPRTHNDYCYNSKCAAAAQGFDEQSRVLLAMPLMHNFPLVLGLLPVHSTGGTVVLTESFDPQAILQAIEQNRANALGTVPAILHRLLEVEPEARERYDLSSLKRAFWGANTLEVEAQLRFREVFHCDTDQSYGMAEGLVCSTRPSDSLDKKMRTQGRPISEADEVKVADVNTGAEVPAGEMGECWARGPYTFRGYYRSPERNREVITPDGYYRTGDLVRKDTQGNVVHLGRLKDCINRGGEKINAEEVEDHILKHLKVKHVAVVAMPDRVMGERVCAFVVPEPNETVTLEELQRFLLEEQKIAKFKVPERLEFIDELPVTSVGKFEKKSLREKIAEIVLRETNLEKIS